MGAMREGPGDTSPGPRCNEPLGAAVVSIFAAVAHAFGAIATILPAVPHVLEGVAGEGRPAHGVLDRQGTTR
jgi:hypothetical protein